MSDHTQKRGRMYSSMSQPPPGRTHTLRSNIQQALGCLLIHVFRLNVTKCGIDRSSAACDRVQAMLQVVRYAPLISSPGWPDG